MRFSSFRRTEGTEFPTLSQQNTFIHHGGVQKNVGVRLNLDHRDIHLSSDSCSMLLKSDNRS